MDSTKAYMINTMKQLFLIFLLLTSINTGAQMSAEYATGKIRGKIIDASEGVPLPYATVAIYKTDSTLVDGGITDENGVFVFDVDPGEFYLEIQFIAYNKLVLDNINVIDRRTHVDLGIIKLERSTFSLNEVVVQGERSEMVIGVDRKIFNVGKDLSNTGTSAAEVLDNIPTVAVDAEGNVSLRGSGGVRMLINGKPSGLVNSGNADALRALQGNMIERVEVITNPSARYEAEGMVGIINIVLKKDQRKGFNASLEASTGHPTSYSLGANLNFRREVINYFLSYGIRYSERDGDGYSNQIFPLADPAFQTRLSRDRLRSGWSNNVRAGADIFINSTTTLTAAALVSVDNEENQSSVRYFDYLLGSATPYESSLREDLEKEEEHDLEFSLNLEKQFSNDDHKLNFFIQYMKDGETEDSKLEERVLSGESVDNPVLYQMVLNEEGENNLMFEGDYVLPLGQDAKFEAGLRGELRTIRNPYAVQELINNSWMELPEYTNDFKYDENVVAAYLQGANKFGNIGVQLGLRAEYSDIKTFLEQGSVENDRQYIDFFPTAHVTYNFNPYNAWQISYSRRIHRPHFRHLNPFYGLSDSRNIRTGNPELEPEYTNAYESGYVYTPGKTSVYAGLYYRHTTGVVEDINYVDEDGITYSVPRNLSKRSAYGAETNLSFDLFEWWNLSGNLNLYRMQTEGVFTYNTTTTDLSSDTHSWDTRINSRMNWDSNLSLQTTFFYRGKQETTQGLRKPFYMLNATVSKDLFKGNGTITLNVRDILNSRKFRYNIDQPDLISENEFRWSGRQIGLTFIYRINQNKKPERGGNGNDNGDYNDPGY